MWKKLWETVDGHDSGRWQWYTDSVNAHSAQKVAVPCQISDGSVGLAYPGVWLAPDAICVPPGIGKCITRVEEAERNQIVASMR